MGAILRLLLLPFRILLWPFRALGRLIFRASRTRTATTVRKAAGNLAAGDAATIKQLPDLPPPTTSFPFRTIERPKLAERSATEMTLEMAEQAVDQARRFYDYQFDMFPQGNLFYEEIELEELAYALGADDDQSTDRRFVVWMDLFRRTLNDNARRLFLIYAPLVFAAVMALTLFAITKWPTLSGVPGAAGQALPSIYVFLPLLILLGLGVLVLLYQWPFRVILTRNLLGLDNYITSRFSRINQNFQVAKRYALNVERNKRMHQAEELKYEAGVWTVSYNWLAMRLFLGERVVRNQMYQINRNATLYSLGGVVFCLLLLSGGLAGLYTTAPMLIGWESVGILTGGATLFILIAYILIMGGAAAEPSNVLRGNEWFRFGATELDRTIADHVGEDKLQIVTFRDRNRIE